MRYGLLVALVVCGINGPALATPNSGGYCAAIRGNGELAPAQWGALAHLTEFYGLPKAMSGGSSASITMFLVESVAKNPWIESNLEAALLIKALVGYWEVVKSGMAGAQKLSKFYVNEGAINLMKKAVAIRMGLTNSDRELEKAQRDLTEIANELKSTGLGSEFINPELKNYLEDAIQLILEADLNNAQVRDQVRAQVALKLKEVEDAIRLLGKFNARTDNNLFVRNGVVNFQELARLFGYMGNFLAGYNMTANQKELFKSFIHTCAPVSRGKTWTDLSRPQTQGEVACQDEVEKFKKLIADYRDGWINNPESHIQLRIQENVGETIPSLVSTSVITGEAVKKYRNLRNRYLRTTDPELGKTFSVSFNNELRFGYWGPNEVLKKAARGIKRFQDLKSKKFLSLGSDKWLTALSLSPAEPGLSSFLPINNHPEYLSAGGWPDLHPTLILRAMGCDDVIYITRQGGETVFGQGVVKRLTNLDGLEWENLTPEKNNIGIPEDKKTTWSYLYNLANEKSALKLSIAAASKIVCTDWDRFDITKTGLDFVFRHGYSAKVGTQSDFSNVPGCH